MMTRHNIYGFDMVNGRPMILDGATGEAATTPAGELLDGLLDYLADDHSLLRRFAIWCAEGTLESAPASALELLGGARRSLEESQDLAALRERYAGEAVSAGAVGLGKRAANAAAFFAAYASADRDVRCAARIAAQMARLHAEFRHSPKDADLTAQKQIDWLLDRMRR